jgi:hypothetical protein
LGVEPCDGDDDDNDDDDDNNNNNNNEGFGKMSWPDLRYYSCIRLKGLRKTT